MKILTRNLNVLVPNWQNSNLEYVLELQGETRAWERNVLGSGCDGNISGQCDGITDITVNL